MRSARAPARPPCATANSGADSHPCAFARGQLVQKFFADRGTHLAAMVAYFALLSFVPLVFLALSLFGLAHRADASDFFVKELKRAFPGTSLDEHHHARPPRAGQRRGARDHRRRRPALVVALALQRARVGAQHRLRAAEPAVPPREGHRRGSDGERRSTTLFVSLVVGALGVERAQAQPPASSRTAPSSRTSSRSRVSLVGVFVFLLAVVPLAAEYAR